MSKSSLLLRISATLALGLGTFEFVFGSLVVLPHPVPPGLASSSYELIPSIVAASVPVILGAIALWRPNIAMSAGAHGWILGRFPHLLQQLIIPSIPLQIARMVGKSTVYVVGVNQFDLVLPPLALIGLLLCAIAEMRNCTAVG